MGLGRRMCRNTLHVARTTLRSGVDQWLLTCESKRLDLAPKVRDRNFPASEFQGTVLSRPSLFANAQ